MRRPPSNDCAAKYRVNPAPDEDRGETAASLPATRQVSGSIVCITGMHRSGTSMVARMLASIGLWLGPADRLMHPKPDNPDGFFENLDMVRLGDELLDRMGGSWDLPPPPSNEAEARARLESALPRAASLLESLAVGAEPGTPFGWKDPRASLMLGFWQYGVPGLRVVACLRHPLAVARSLKQRHRVSTRFGLRLWHEYNAALLPHVRSGRVLVTHYEAWLLDAADELRRVAGHVGLNVDGARADKLAGGVKPGRDHHTEESAAALVGAAGHSTAALYDIMCSYAGPVYQRSAAWLADPPSDEDVSSTEDPPTAPDELQLLRHRVNTLDARLRRADERVAPYRMGTLIDARKGGNGPLYLGEGWAAAQEGGTWSVGHRANLILAPFNLPSGSGAVLHARVRPMIGPQAVPLRVSMQVEGIPVAHWSLDRPQGTDLSCKVPAELIASGSPLRLGFSIESPRSPLSLGLSRDARPLGLLLVSMRLQAVGSG